MNIGIFTDCFTPEINGVVTSLQLFIAAFHQQGHEVFVFAPNNSLKMQHTLQTNTRQYPSILVWGKQVRLTLPFIRANNVAKLNLDIIHIYTPGPLGITGMRIGKKLNIPLVYTYHTRVERYAHYYLHLPAWLEKGTLALVAKRFYNQHDIIITPSTGIKKELEKYVTKPIVVIPTGVDITECQQLANKNDLRKILKKYYLKPEDKLLITTSRIGKEKNIAFILDAFVKIKQSCPKAKLLIAGDGPDKEAMKKYARKIASSKDIIFLGFLNHSQLFSLYRVARAFLFSSLTETQGMVILEAMTMGLPTVALTATGVEDLLTDNTGGFMTDDHTDNFAQKTISLLKDDVLWKNKKQEALRHAEDFSIEKMAEKVIGVYQGLRQNKQN